MPSGDFCRHMSKGLDWQDQRNILYANLVLPSTLFAAVQTGDVPRHESHMMSHVQASQDLTAVMTHQNISELNVLSSLASV